VLVFLRDFKTEKIIAITKMLSTLKDNSIKYPVMNLICANRFQIVRIRNIVVSIYPIDNTRKEKEMVTQITVHFTFCAYNVGCFIKTPKSNASYKTITKKEIQTIINRDF
jgi:hypothetical protein